MRDANLLGATALAIVDRIDDAIADHTGRTSAAAALGHIRERPGETVDFLARVLGLTHSGAVRLIDRLVAGGLVARGTAADRRARALHLTAAGERAAQAALDERARVLRDVLSLLAPDERADLVALLEKVLAGLTGDRWSARHICRLCDHPRCMRDTCPVDEAATARDRNVGSVEAAE